MLHVGAAWLPTAYKTKKSLLVHGLEQDDVVDSVDRLTEKVERKATGRSARPFHGNETDGNQRSISFNTAVALLRQPVPRGLG